MTHVVRESDQRSAAEGARILIVEPHSVGHHSTYLRWAVEAVTERGWTAVVATTAAALEHPLLAGLEPTRAGVELRTIDTVFPSGATANRLEIIRRELLYWRAIRRVVSTELARGRVAAVVLPYLDYCFFACGVLGVPHRGVPWHVVSMRLSVMEGGARGGVPWKWRLVRRVLAAPALRTLFAINPSVRRVPGGWLTTAAAAKVKYLPDPAEHRGPFDRAAARPQLGLTDGRLAVLVFGSIDERKGLGRLAAALAADPELRPYVLVVAGMQSETLAQSLRGAPFTELRSEQRLIELDRVLDDAEQAAVFAAADVVWLGYERHSYMSGVLVLAGQAAVPVVATDEGEVGAFVREHEIGLLVEVTGTQSVRAALLRLTDASARSAMGRRARAAVADHTPAHFKRGLIAAIESGGE